MLTPRKLGLPAIGPLIKAGRLGVPPPAAPSRNCSEIWSVAMFAASSVRVTYCSSMIARFSFWRIAAWPDVAARFERARASSSGLLVPSA